MLFAYDTDILLRGVIIQSANAPISILFSQRAAEDQKEMEACKEFFENEIERILLYSVKDEWKNHIRTKVENFANEVYALRESDLPVEKVVNKLKEKLPRYGLVEAFEKIATENWKEEIDIFLGALDRNYFILAKRSTLFEKENLKHDKWKKTFIKEMSNLATKSKDQDLENLVACACLTEETKNDTTFVLIDKGILKHKKKIEQTGKYQLLKPSEVSR